MTSLPVCQVAFVYLAGSRLWEWYRDGFGFIPSGATLFAGPPAGKVNGLPFPVFPGHWLLDGQARFQLEFFRFVRPKSKPRRADETPADVGYRMIGIHTVEFEQTMARLAERGSVPIGPVMGGSRERRACVRDPEGNWVEVMEADPLAGIAPAKERPDVPATVRSVTISVDDLDAARAAWVDGLGLAPSPVESLHGPEHEALWGLTGAKRKSVLLDGGGVLIELVEYIEPKGRPRPEGYRICDQGMMNVALGAPDKQTYDRTFAEWAARGMTPADPSPLDAGIFRVMYFDTPTGQNVELIYPRRWAWSLTGFSPSGTCLAEEVVVDAPAEAVWDAVTDHDSFGEWSAMKMKLVEPGATDRNGVGSLRKVTVMGLSFYERVFAFDPPRRYAYRIERGPLIKSHRGDVVLSPEDGKTRVRWAIRIGLKVPGAGAPNALILRRKMAESLRRLKVRLESGRG